MTDLEMTKLCAEAMGYPPDRFSDLKPYNPLKKDWQAMDLEDWLLERGELFFSNGYGTFTYGGAIFHSREKNKGNYGEWRWAR